MYSLIMEANPADPKKPKLRLTWISKPYVRKTPKTDADLAAIAKAQEKRARIAKRNIKLNEATNSREALSI